VHGNVVVFRTVRCQLTTRCWAALITAGSKTLKAFQRYWEHRQWINRHRFEVWVFSPRVQCCWYSRCLHSCNDSLFGLWGAVRNQQNHLPYCESTVSLSIRGMAYICVFFVYVLQSKWEQLVQWLIC